MLLKNYPAELLQHPFRSLKVSLKVKKLYIYIIQKYTIKDMPKCDICNKYFKTKAQMKQHKTKEHTQKITGTKFRIPK